MSDEELVDEELNERESTRQMSEENQDIKLHEILVGSFKKAFSIYRLIS